MTSWRFYRQPSNGHQYSKGVLVCMEVKLEVVEIIMFHYSMCLPCHEVDWKLLPRWWDGCYMAPHFLNLLSMAFGWKSSKSSEKVFFLKNKIIFVFSFSFFFQKTNVLFLFYFFLFQINFISLSSTCRAWSKRYFYYFIFRIYSFFFTFNTS